MLHIQNLWTFLFKKKMQQGVSSRIIIKTCPINITITQQQNNLLLFNKDPAIYNIK